jgi:hypothetical protein
MLAISSHSDPALGDPRFVSAARISPALAPLSWFSTIPYLSIILSNFIGWSSIPLEITSGYRAERQQGTGMHSLSFRRRHANWFGFILACIDKR